MTSETRRAGLLGGPGRRGAAAFVAAVAVMVAGRGVPARVAALDPATLGSSPSWT